MNFRIPITLPLSQQRVYCGELTNQHLMCLLKYITVNDNQVIANAFDELISELTQLDASRMFSIDKFALLMDIKSIFWSNQLEFQPKHGNRVRIAISNIIENLNKLINKSKLFHTVAINGLEVTLSMPRKFAMSIDDILHQIIYTINDGGNMYVYDDFTVEQQQQFIESLPADTYNTMTAVVDEFQKQLNQGFLINSNSQLHINEYPVDVLGVHTFELLKSVFADDLLGLYELQYNLTTKMNVSYDHFMQMTPNETKIYINFHNRDIKRQQETQNKHNHTSPVGGIPGNLH